MEEMDFKGTKIREDGEEFFFSFWTLHSKEGFSYRNIAK